MEIPNKSCASRHVYSGWPSTLLMMLVAVASPFTPQAKAGTIVESFAISGNGITSSGTINLTTTGNPAIDDITGITGSFSTATGGGFSGSITGLNPGCCSDYNSDAPNFESGGLRLSWDDLFYPSGSGSASSGTTCVASGGFLDFCGLNFLVADGLVTYEVALFSNGGGAGGDGRGDGVAGSSTFIDGASNPNLGTAVSFVVTPEPSSLGLVLLGLLGVAVVRWRLIHSARRPA